MEDEGDSGQLSILGLCLFLLPFLGWLVGGGFAEGDELALVNELAGGGLLVGLAILFVLVAVPRIAGQSRGRMSFVFSSSARLIMLALAVSVVIQACLFAYVLFTLEGSIFHRVHGGLILVVGLGALAVCISLIRFALGMFSSHATQIRGFELDRTQAPRLHARIEALANKLGSICPDNIAIGLEPNFFVTSAPSELVGQNRTLKGQTLFVSLAGMRLLSEEEFDAVVGHELGHFRGEDTRYSLKFAPTYTRLSRALYSLSQQAGNASDIGKVPATLALSIYLSNFALSERSVGRQRELEADRAGASVASARALARALLKIALFTENWSWLSRQHIAELNEGRTFTNLSLTYSEVCKISPDAEWAALLGSIAGITQSHPVDTHPTFAERLLALDIDPSSMMPDDCVTPELSSAELIDVLNDLDRGLSDLEANWLLAIGAARLPASHEEYRERQ